MSSPPFRADHVGSLLRPPELLAARAGFDRGELAAEALRAVEDQHIIDAVRLQESVGLQSITDGEYRRVIYFSHFPAAVSGFTEMEMPRTFRDEQGRELRYTGAVVTGKLRRQRGIATEEFLYVRSLTERTPKVTLPSPTQQVTLRWREGVSDRAYPDRDELHEDVVRIYREELNELGRLGCTYVQLDDVTLGLLCDENQRAQILAAGEDLDQVLERHIRLVNEALMGRPAGMVIAMHICRGNNQSRWLGEGGYEAIADRIFGGLRIDAFFLEYDTPRAGSFEPLARMPRERRVVLGLVSSKTPELEPADDLVRRLDEAARYFPIERLAISPQCGFASTAPGNSLTAADQEAKLRLVVGVADRVWG